MRKITKLKRLEGAVIGFHVATPESGVGELDQYAIIKVTGVYKAKTNNKYYVKGVALKRIEDGTSVKIRQYQIDRIVDRTIVVIADNEFTLAHPKGKAMNRLGDPRVRYYDPTTKYASASPSVRAVACPGLASIKKGLTKLRDR